MVFFQNRGALKNNREVQNGSDHLNTGGVLDKSKNTLTISLSPVDRVPSGNVPRLTLNLYVACGVQLDCR